MSKSPSPGTDPEYHQHDYSKAVLGSSDRAEEDGLSNDPNLSQFNTLPQKELLVMTIDIGGGRKDVIQVYENDNAYDLATRFCEKHHLNPNVAGPLSQNIQINIDQVIKDRLQLIAQLNAEWRKELVSQPDESQWSNVRKPTGTPLRNAQPLQSVSNQSLHSGSFGKASNRYQAYSPSEISKRPKTPETRGRFSADPRINTGHPSDSMLDRSINNQTKLSESNIIDGMIARPYNLTPNARDGYHSNPELTFHPQINHNSRLMLVHKYQHRSMSVYDRLHDKAKIEAKRNFLKQDVNNNSALKDQSRHKSSYLNKSAIGEEINYGSLLYHKGLQKKENRQKLAAHLLQKKLEKEEKDCTFKPQINPISIEIVNSKSRMESTEDHLIRYGKQKREKIDRLRGIRKMEEIEECSFRPEICLISQKIVEEKEKYHPNLEKDKHTKLYEESKLKQAQQELRSRMINDIECTFTPEINTSMNQNVLNTSFEERTKIYVERKEKTMQDIKQKYTKELVDEETQMPYFKPLVGRPPKNQQLAGHNVWSHLYNQRVGLEKNKRELEERYLQQAHSNVVRPSENSELIVRGVRRKRLEEIFQALDSDNDGFISQNRIDISQIPTSVLEILAPIFCEMEEHELTLSLEDFVHQTEELLKTLPVSAKDSLIARKKETSGTPKYDFKPQINQNSERIAQKKRPQTAGTMYDMYYEQQQLLREKLKQEREKKLQEELKKCSFKPIFFTNPHVNRLNHSSSTHLR